MPLGEREGGAADAGGLPGRPDPGDARALLHVDGHGRSVQAAAEAVGEIGVREHAVADGQGVAGDVPPGATPDLSAVLEGGDRDAGQPVVAVGAHDGVPGEDADTVAQEAGGVSGALGELAGQGAGVAGDLLRAGRFDERRHPCPGRREPGRHGQQQRPSAGDDGGPAGHHQRALEHGLGAPGGEDAGQGPARKGQDVLVASGGEQHGVRVHGGRLVLTRPEQRVHGEDAGPLLDEPHVMPRQDAYVTGGEPVPQSLPGAPPVVERLWPPGAQFGRGLPEELPARPVRRVHDGDPHPAGGRRQRRREPGRPGPDHREVSPHGRFPPGCGSRRPGARGPGRHAGWGGR